MSTHVPGFQSSFELIASLCIHWPAAEGLNNQTCPCFCLFDCLIFLNLELPKLEVQWISLLLETA